MRKILLLLTIIVAFSACTKENKAVKKSITKAQSLIESKDLVGAKEILSNSISQYPKEKSIPDAQKLLEQINEKIAKENLEKQEVELAKAEKLFEDKNYSQSKTVIEGFVKIAPESSIASKGKELLKKIEEIEITAKFDQLFKEEKFYSARILLDDPKISYDVESALSAKLNTAIDKKLAVLSKNFNTNHDKWKEASFIHHKSAREYNNVGSYIEMYFVKSDNSIFITPRLKFHYDGNSWVFFDEISVKIDNLPTKKINIKSSQWNTYPGGVCETADVFLFTDHSLEEIPFSLIQDMAYGKNVDVRFSGNRYAESKLSVNDKKALKEALEYFLLNISKEKYDVERSLLKDQGFKSKNL